MLTRMLVMVDREADPKERYALVLMGQAIGTHFEAVCRHDNYAMCDYWATYYNLGRAAKDEVVAALLKGYEGVPSPEDRAEAERNRSDPTFVASSNDKPGDDQVEDDGGDGNYR